MLEVLHSYKKLGCWMALKMHLLGGSYTEETSLHEISFVRLEGMV
jgi:hypothetical protein